MEAVQVIAIAKIKPRASGDTRELDLGHIVGLAESIGVLGLIEPVVIDKSNQLLAGAHRWNASRLVAIAEITERQKAFATLVGRAKGPKILSLAKRISNLDRSGWVSRHPDNKIPVRAINIDSDKDVNDALSIEIAENEKRRDYTLDEVQSLAKRLRKAGYVEIEGGRPKAGEKRLRPMLAAVIGKSERQIRRLLRGVRSETRPAGQVSAKKNSRSVVTWAEATKYLSTAIQACRVVAKDRPQAKQFLALLAQVEKAVKSA